MKIDIDENMTSTPKTQHRTKTKASAASRKKTPEEKIAELCKKEKWTAKDAGHFLFHVLERCYDPFEPGIYVTDEQWSYYANQVCSFTSRQSAAFKSYDTLYDFYTKNYLYIELQVEGLCRGVEEARSRVIYDVENEKAEKRVEQQMKSIGASFNGDPFEGISDTYALYSQNGGYAFRNIITSRIDPCWRFVTAWNIFTKEVGNLYGLKEECFNLCMNLEQPIKLLDTINEAIDFMSNPQNLSSHGANPETKAKFIRDEIPKFDYNGKIASSDRISHFKDMMKQEKNKGFSNFDHKADAMLSYLSGRTKIIEGLDENN